MMVDVVALKAEDRTLVLAAVRPSSLAHICVSAFLVRYRDIVESNWTTMFRL
jgi:hypothetical protein